MKLVPTLLATVLMASGPALAQDNAVPPDVDRVLWCASAFYWLAGSAEDSGDKTEAEMYDRWSQALLDMGGVSLTARGFVPDQIETLIATYDERVLNEVGAPDAPYDVANCPTLMGEIR